jgi:subfamily B ATP-binding cassette protein MsbA
LPDGYKTNVGEKGVKLSGGQRQRIAIAREIFKDPELLIFDEATSSLDSESEEMIKKSIRGIKGSVTMLIITHRLSTVKSCDNIYVLSGGKIVENGSFIKLYSKNGIFKQMCDIQQIKI